MVVGWTAILHNQDFEELHPYFQTVRVNSPPDSQQARLATLQAALRLPQETTSCLQQPAPSGSQFLVPTQDGEVCWTAILAWSIPRSANY
jgi:hypothetical protein